MCRSSRLKCVHIVRQENRPQHPLGQIISACAERLMLFRSFDGCGPSPRISVSRPSFIWNLGVVSATHAFERSVKLPRWEAAALQSGLPRGPSIDNKVHALLRANRGLCVLVVPHDALSNNMQTDAPGLL
jgi:hypothetical protein